jgi:GAF domain-containing protein
VPEMSDIAEPTSEEALREAKQTIARLEDEVERYKRRLAEDALAGELRELLALTAATGAIAAPVGHARLLEMIVETAAHVIRARAASLLLVDEATQELVFEVAIGEKAHEVKKFRVPLGHGIAGLVAATGQPMAISGADRDPRQAADIARAVDYFPHSILCLPLSHDGRVIGVLELLDKEGAPSFSLADMEALNLFANQAAIAIALSGAYGNLAELFGDAFASLGGVSEERKRLARDQVASFAASVQQDAQFQQALELARLVREIAQHGSQELGACEVILRGFAEYLRQRRLPRGEPWAAR